MEDDFLPSDRLDWVKEHVKLSEGNFHREGYSGTKSIRDLKDPRGCGTYLVKDKRNILDSIWYTNLWCPKIVYQVEDSPIYKHARATHGRGDSTLLSVYYDKDFYGLHDDIDMESIVSCVLMLSFPEASFSGGDLVICEEVIKHKDNRLIMFPSVYPHEVTKIDNNSNRYLAQRFTLQHFISAVRVKNTLIDESSNIQ